MIFKPVAKKELKKFALTLGIFLAVLGLLLFVLKKAPHAYVWGTGLGLILLGFALPVVLTPLYRLWMGLAVVLNFIMLRLILSLVFYLVITPIGRIGRLFGKRFLDIGKDPERPSYWHPREPREFERERYEQQF